MSRKWVFVAVLLVVGLFLVRVRVVLMPFILAAIIAYVAYPLMVVFERRSVPRPMAIILVYAVFAVVVGVIVSFFIPRLTGELEEILKVLPRQTERLEWLGRDAVRHLPAIPLPETLQEGFNLVVRRVQQLLEQLAARLAELLIAMVSQILSLVISPFLAFYILRDLPALKRGFFRYIPRQYRRDLYTLLAESNKVVSGFIRGQLVISAIVGLMLAGGLALVGVRYALFIGILAGLFDIIPYFGPFIGFVPALMVSLLRSPLTALWASLVFLAVNQLESSIIGPKIMGDRVGLHPLAVIFAVLAGGELMGIMGMLLAVPVAGVARVVLKFLATRQNRT